MKLLLFSVLLLIAVGIPLSVRGQDAERKRLSDISITENHKKEIVRRILTYKLKPSTHSRVIHLVGSGIEATWLPTIRNIEFRILSDEEAVDDTGVYFFTEASLDGRTYYIGLGYGDPECDYAGIGWHFRVTENRLRLWRAGSIGGSCIYSHSKPK